MEPSQQTLTDHLNEVRHRLFWVVLVLIAGSTVGYFIHGFIIDALLRPLDSDQPLIYTSPAGGLEFLFKICLFFGFIVTIPVLIYHIVRFIEPIMFRQTYRYLAMLLIASIALLVMGGAFAYFISLPAAMHFLTQFNTGQLQALISTNEYMSFVMVYVAGFALLFQIPLLLLFINKVTPLQPRKLLSYQRFVILISFIVAAIMTPTPDPVNQFLMAAPIIVLYQVGVGLVWLANRNRKVDSEEIAEEDLAEDFFDKIAEEENELTGWSQGTEASNKNTELPDRQPAQKTAAAALDLRRPVGHANKVHGRPPVVRARVLADTPHTVNPHLGKHVEKVVSMSPMLDLTAEQYPKSYQTVSPHVLDLSS